MYLYIHIDMYLYTHTYTHKHLHTKICCRNINLHHKILICAFHITEFICPLLSSYTWLSCCRLYTVLDRNVPFMSICGVRPN